MKVHEIITPVYMAESVIPKIQWGSAASSVLKTLKIIGVSAIGVEFANEKINLDALHTSGKITEEQYQLENTRLKDILTAQIVAVLSTGIIIKFLTTFLSVSKFLPFGIGKLIGGLLTMGSTVISSVAVAYISSPTGRQKFAELVSEGILNGLSDAFYGLFNTIKDAIMGMYDQGKKWYDTGEIPDAPAVSNPTVTPDAPYGRLKNGNAISPTSYTNEPSSYLGPYKGTKTSQ